MAAIVINVAGSYDDKAIKQAQDSLGKLSGSTSSAGSKMGSAIGKTFKGIGLAAGVAGAAFAGAATTLVSWGQEAQASLSVSRSTEAIIKSTGGAAGVTADQVGKLSQALSVKTGIDDEAIQSASNLILTFQNVKNAGEGQAAMFDRATTAALDLSATGFTSVEGASKMLGKALNDPTKGMAALSRAGVTFTDQEKEKIKALQESGDLLGAQTIIMDKVEAKVGGVAEAAASPFDRLNVMLGNFKENVGAAILPAIEKLVDAIGPVLDQLSGPLGEIAGQLGDLFSSVFASIQPLLPPLISAITQVVGILAGGFMQAIQALVPAVVPLVTLIADLAVRLAPILAPLLQKVAGVLTSVLDAVMPLLGPLADLILNIFAQAAPIIDLAVGILQTLITALEPVFAAVSQLIPPLNQLVTVLFAAIMPILEPLLPIIELLANILGAILVKAVGVLMLALGGLIVGFSKLAPFILSNVTKPVLGFFMDMVGGILSGAESMLGWIPGIGDKVKEANAAFGGLKDGVLNGIEQASQTIQQEGGRIGQDMMDSATKMLTDSEAPKAAASSFTSTMASGLEAGQKDVTKSSQQLAKEAVSGTQEEMKRQKDALKLAGEQTGQGVGEGITKSIEDVKPAVIAGGIDLGKAVAMAVKDGAGVASPSKITYWVGQMVGKGLEEGVKDSMKEATKAGGDAAKEALDRIKEKATAFFDYIKQTRDSLASFGSVTALGAGDANTTPTATGIVANMRQKLAQVRRFGGQLSDLKKLGLNNTSLQEIISAGPEAGSQIAAALLSQGKKAISQVNDLESQFSTASANVGRIGAESQFGMSKAQAQGIRNTNITVKDGAVVVNIGAGTSASDEARIKRVVRDAVQEAVTKVAREASRAGSA